MAGSPDDAAAAMIANLPEQTGRSLEQWITVVKKSGLAKHGEIVKMLKSEHGVTHGYANLIAHKTRGSDAGSASSGDDLVDAQYSGDKADLRPIYDRLAGAVSGFGKDVEFAPKKAYVSLRRSKQFGLIQPSTKTRVDVGINLKGRPAGERLEASGSFNAMVSHRVRVTAAKEVDAELIAWLREAYDQA
jgi:hypothetical protein